MQVNVEAMETTQPDKERNSFLQLTALRLTAFHLPWRLSLAEQWQEQGGSHLRRVLPPGGGGGRPGLGWGWLLSLQAVKSPQPAGDMRGEAVEEYFAPR